MPRATLSRLILLVISITLLACRDNSRGPVEPSFQTNEWCDLHPIECNGGIGDPTPGAAGYYLGADITPARCFSPTGLNITDVDKDGMSDSCEGSLAAAFRPSLSLAPASYDCDPTKEPYWAAKYFPAHGSQVRIAYLFGYHIDCGDTGGLIGSLLSKLIVAGSITGVIDGLSLVLATEISKDDPGASHSGDSEWVMVDVRYDYDAAHWVLNQVKFSAHYGTSADGSELAPASAIQFPDKIGGYPRVWVARNKHANYRNRDRCKANRLAGVTAADNCDANLYDVERLPYIGLRNIGSRRVNFISPGTCVRSTQPAFYPGTECFWVPKDNFNGWAQYPFGHPATAYYDLLIVEFECYSYTGSTSKLCSDLGVNRR